MEKMIENQPPAKKLKQAKLPFFNATPIKEATKTQQPAQSKKRRSSLTQELPSTCIKDKKALTPLDSPNSKASKKRKLSSQLTSEEKTNEVSSSSEAESTLNKQSNGKCCLLDRFVRVLPLDAQEISSTNETLDISIVQEDKVIDSSVIETVAEENANKDKDCIIINDDSNGAEQISLTHNLTHSSSEMANPTAVHSEECEKDKHGSEDIKKDTEVDDTNATNLTDVSMESDANVSQEIDASVEDTGMESEANLSYSSDVLSSTPLKPRRKSAANKSKTSTPSGSEPSAKKRKVGSVEKEVEKNKKKEEKEKERLEKKKKLEEEKAEKERIKQEKKEAKEKERQELKEKQEKEKLEKERAKEEERKKKEDEKLKKEEEKKKKQAAVEAKQEEKRKKEEEKIKEEEEKKKKEEKAKQVFQKFFIKSKENPVKQEPTTGIFIPFQLKKDMILAPVTRRDALTEEKKTSLDTILSNSESCKKTYLEQLKNGEIEPIKTGKVLRKNPKIVTDVEVIHDSETLKKVTKKVKLLQFHTDYRPPYYGTWRKQPKLTARNPWKKDQSLFDYEIDSDEEWEEEEPGESLSCSDGEEEKGEEADEDEDDGWMVPHGYLSEGEGCSGDEEITPEKLKQQQLAKAKAWEEEQSRKLQVAPLITVGCFFQYSPSATMSGDVRLLYEFRAFVLAPATPIPTCLYGSSEPEKEELTAEKTQMSTTPKGPRKKSVPDEAMPDLIKLTHGNVSGIKKLIREFRLFWLKKTDPTFVGPESPEKEDKVNDSFLEKDVDNVDLSVNESMVCDSEDKEDKNDEADRVKDKMHGISKRQLDLTINSIAVREKREGFNKICWYVHDQVLNQYNMADIQLPNSWVYVTAPPRFHTPNPKSQGVIKSDANTPKNSETEKMDEKLSLKDQRSIKDFALSKKELAKKLESQQSKTSECVSTPEASLKSLDTLIETPKEAKKINNQKTIMDFARKVVDPTKTPVTQDKLSMDCSVVLKNLDHVFKTAVGQSDIVNSENSTETANCPPSSSLDKGDSNVKCMTESSLSPRDKTLTTPPADTKRDDVNKLECIVID